MSETQAYDPELVPEGWEVAPDAERAHIEFESDDCAVEVAYTIKQAAPGVETTRSVTAEAQANSYTVIFRQSPGEVGGHHTEIATFDAAEDAVEFAQYVALYASTRPGGGEFIAHDFEPDGHTGDSWEQPAVISDTAPRTVAEKLLEHLDPQLEDAIEAQRA